MRSVERSACISGSSCGADLDDGVQVGPVVPEEIRQALQAHFRAHVREVPTRTEVASEGCVLLFFYPTLTMMTNVALLYTKFTFVDKFWQH